jgi:hypothetical protein
MPLGRMRTDAKTNMRRSRKCAPSSLICRGEFEFEFESADSVGLDSNAALIAPVPYVMLVDLGEVGPAAGARVEIWMLAVSVFVVWSCVVWAFRDSSSSPADSSLTSSPDSPCASVGNGGMNPGGFSL